MPIQVQAPLIRMEDGLLVIQLAPSIAIGGQSWQFELMNRFGGVSGRIVKNMASGFLVSSGMNITNSGIGIMTVQVNSQDTSGLPYGNYVFAVTRLDSGNRTAATEGYLLLLP